MGKTRETTVFRHCTTDVKLSERRKNIEVTPNGCTCFRPGSTPETIVEKDNRGRFQDSCWLTQTDLAIQGDEARGICGPKFCKGESYVVDPEICWVFVFAGEIPWKWVKNYREPVRWTIPRDNTRRGDTWIIISDSKETIVTDEAFSKELKKVSILNTKAVLNQRLL